MEAEVRVSGHEVTSAFLAVIIIILIIAQVVSNRQDRAHAAMLAAQREAMLKPKHGTDRVTLDSNGAEMYRVCHCGIEFPNRNELAQHQIEQAELAALGGKS